MSYIDEVLQKMCTIIRKTHKRVAHDSNGECALHISLQQLPETSNRVCPEVINLLLAGLSLSRVLLTILPVRVKDIFGPFHQWSSQPLPLSWAFFNLVFGIRSCSYFKSDLLVQELNFKASHTLFGSLHNISEPIQCFSWEIYSRRPVERRHRSPKETL